VKVVCLTAPPDVAANRVSEREPNSWPGKPWLIEQARRLAEAIPSFDRIDRHVTTDGRPSLGAAPASVESVRLDPELQHDLVERATRARAATGRY
jgi:hypothetical protein